MRILACLMMVVVAGCGGVVDPEAGQPIPDRPGTVAVCGVSATSGSESALTCSDFCRPSQVVSQAISPCEISADS